MAIVRLQVLSFSATAPPRIFVDEAGGQHQLSRLRLRTGVVCVPPNSAHSLPRGDLIPAIIDTGAPITIIPYNVWTSLAALVHFPAARQSVQGFVGGSAYDAWIGSIWLVAVDREDRYMPPIRVIAHFQQKPCKHPKYVLLGLGHGILEGRRLERRPVFDPTEPESSHYTPNYQQQWWLTDW